MPIQASAFRLPSGARGVRVDCIGTISKEDADAYMEQVSLGGQFHGLPVLAVTLQIGNIGPGARGAFIRRGNDRRSERWMAVVVNNPVIRVTTNFVVRISGTKKLRLFETEEEAALWLDERAREDRSSPGVSR